MMISMFFANKWFRGLRGKLTAILATAGLTILALNLGAILGVRDIEYGIRSITEIRMPSIKGLEAMKEGQTAIMQTIGVIESSNDKTEVARMLQRFESKKKQIKEGRDLYDPLPQSPDEAEEYTNTFVKVWQNWQESCDAYIEAHKKNDIKLKQQLYTQTQVTFSPAEDSLAKIIAINYKNAEEDKGSAKAAAQRLLSVGTVLGIFASLFILIFGFYVSEKTANTLTVLANNINESTSQVSAAATQIASASQELSQATQEQASSLSQTTSSVEEMSSMIAKNSESAQTSADTSQKSQRRAQDGRDAVDRMRQSMDAINLSNEAIMTQVNQSNHEMAEIVKVIQEIGTKTKVINDIVFQTKLLSFNASVEAARVGELGKGFAVVAEEVGNLAQMSGNAAREISEMLDSSTAKVERIVSDTKTKVESLIIDGRHKVSTGLEVARQCGDALKAIVDDISQVSEMASQISSANQEQSQGISEINRAMSQLDTVTQQNAATSEQAASAAEELANQSHNLKCAVQELHQTINGRTSHATEDASRSVKVDYLRNRKPSEGKQKTVTVSHSNSTSSQAIVTKNTIAKESNQRTSQNPPTVGNDSIPNRDHDGFIEI